MDFLLRSRAQQDIIKLVNKTCRNCKRIMNDRSKTSKRRQEIPVFVSCSYWGVHTGRIKKTGRDALPDGTMCVERG